MNGFVKMYQSCVLILILSGIGCTYSIEPFFEEEDAIFLPQLLGEWASEDGSGIIIDSLDSKTYQITVFDSLSIKNWIGMTTMIDSRYFIDLTENEIPLGLDDFKLLIPIHIVKRLIITKDTVYFNSMCISCACELISSESNIHYVSDCNSEFPDIYFRDTSKRLSQFIADHPVLFDDIEPSQYFVRVNVNPKE